MAIKSDVVVGAGGLVLPGDHVDVLWIPDSPQDDVTGAQLLAEDVEVVAVEQTIVDVPPTAPGLEADGTDTPVTGNDRVPGTDAAPLPGAVTVTLMVSPAEASRIFCGDSGGSLRLAVRAFGDATPSGLQPVECIIRGQNDQ
jgi:Flp pilus assembly protein CpaB